MTATKLGKVQLKIMNVLWELGSATARQITDQLNRIEPIAHSTVQTLLRGLEEKGAVTHDVEGRTFIFKPTVAEDKVRRRATRELVQRVFDGNAGDLVSYLLKNEKVTREELEQIKRLIKEKSRK